MSLKLVNKISKIFRDIICYYCRNRDIKWEYFITFCVVTFMITIWWNRLCDICGFNIETWSDLVKSWSDIAYDVVRTGEIQDIYDCPRFGYDINLRNVVSLDTMGVRRIWEIVGESNDIVQPSYDAPREVVQLWLILIVQKKSMLLKWCLWTTVYIPLVGRYTFLKESWMHDHRTISCRWEKVKMSYD